MTKKKEESEQKEKIPFKEWFESNKKSFQNKSAHQIVELYIKEFDLPHFVYFGYIQFFAPGRCLYPLEEHLKLNKIKRNKNTVKIKE